MVFMHVYFMFLGTFSVYCLLSLFILLLIIFVSPCVCLQLFHFLGWTLSLLFFLLFFTFICFAPFMFQCITQTISFDGWSVNTRSVCVSDMRRCRRIVSISLVALLIVDLSLCLLVSGWGSVLSSWSCSKLTRKPSVELLSTRLVILLRQLGECKITIIYYRGLQFVTTCI